MNNPGPAYGAFSRAINALGALFVFSVVAFTAAAAQAEDGPFTILVLGDSLSAGHQLAPDEGFVPQLEARLIAEGHDVDVLNKAESGITSADGLSRIEWVLDGLDDLPDLVILELGANDALRGLDPAITRRNMEGMAGVLAERDIPTIIAGMLAPPNLGREYASEFNPIFADVAEADGFVLYPFFLDGVAAQAHLNLADGMHPNAEGVAVIVEGILPTVKRFLVQETAQR